MAISTTHPLYDYYAPYWKLTNDSYKGDEVVKEEGVTYLPATPGQVLDGMETGKTGRVAYEAYKARALFPDYYQEAVEKFTGLLHQRDATFELPEDMEYLREKASAEGESLLALLRRINESQLVSGRLGLLTDFANIATANIPEFYIALYSDLSIRNWDESADNNGVDKLNLVVLDETCPIRGDDYTWTIQEQYRYLELIEGKYKVTTKVENFEDKIIDPTVLGNAFDEIPFTFVNSKDLLPRPDLPPLINLARICMAIYRADADYRQALFMQSQDTLVVIGGSASDEALRVGAGAKIDCDINGDAKYIGVNSNGLPEQRQALENDKRRAEILSGKLVTTQKGNQESGEALKTRLAAQTATLDLIAKTGAKALEVSLKRIARWIGSDESKVKVIPNLEFADANLMGDDLVKLMTAKGLGAPISIESIHNLLVERGLTTMDYETEKSKLELEPKPDPQNPQGDKPDNQVKGVLDNGATK